MSQGIIEGQTTPFGLWRYGEDFRKSGVLVAAENPYVGFMPFYFLMGQSIELFLKAFLLGNGVPLQDLRRKPFGHNLESLLEAAIERNLARYSKLELMEVAVINVLSIEYPAKRFQYIKTGTMSLPEEWIVINSAKTLSVGLERFCEEVPCDAL